MPILTQTAAWFRSSCNRLLANDCFLCGRCSTDLLCPECRHDLPALPDEICPRCALPASGAAVCGRCLAKPPAYDRTLAAFRYAFPLDRLIQSFKYNQRLALGRYFGKHLALLAQNCEADRIVPLPLHPHRLRERGFNQAVELARLLSRQRQIPLDTQSCQRTRKTAAQADLPWRERARNVRGAFACSQDVHGEHLLLVDDVMTTGASLDELARTVKLHGAAQVTLLVVARALPP